MSKMLPWSWQLEGGRSCGSHPRCGWRWSTADQGVRIRLGSASVGSLQGQISFQPVTVEESSCVSSNRRRAKPFIGRKSGRQSSNPKNPKLWHHVRKLNLHRLPTAMLGQQRSRRGHMTCIDMPFPVWENMGEAPGNCWKVPSFDDRWDPEWKLRLLCLRPKPREWTPTSSTSPASWPNSLRTLSTSGRQRRSPSWCPCGLNSGAGQRFGWCPKIPRVTTSK